MVSDIADYDIGYLVNGTTRFSVIVSAARVPAVRRNDVNLASDMAEAESSTRDNWNGIRIVVATPEVIHLRARDKPGTHEGNR